MTRPALLFHCQHSLGLGHLVRSLALAERLADHFDVTLLSGGALPPRTAAPPGVEIVPLPPLELADGRTLVSSDPARTLDEARRLRREAIQRAFRRTCPQVVLVELFPFGRKKLADELVPLLEAARAAAAPPLVACSLRDVLVTGRDDQELHDERAAILANRWLDAVLVHGDPRLARLEESFRPRTPLAVPVHYTGFVLCDPPLEPAPDSGVDVLVSAGGGRVGGPLLRAAVDAHALQWRSLGLRTRIVGGPFLPEEVWDSLVEAAAGLQGLELRRTVPSVAAELVHARASVSQGGYNTTLEVLRSGVPALVVPFAAPGEDEQTRRARRLEARGAIRVLDPRLLSAATLADAVVGLLRFRPVPLRLELDGARRSAELLARLARASVPDERVAAR